MRITLLLVALFVAPTWAGTIKTPPRDMQAWARGERSPQLQVVSSPASWLRKAEHAGVVYFLYVFPARVERYALSTESWLPPIVLTAAPRGFAVSDSGIVVNYSTKVSRFNLTGTNESTLPTVWSNADDTAILGDYLLSVRDQKIQSVRLSDMTQVAIYESLNDQYTPRRIAVAQEGRAIYGWKYLGGASFILRIPVNPDGTFKAHQLSPYFGTFPVGAVLFPDRDGSTLIDDAGIGYNGSTLVYRSGTGGPINDAVKSGSNRFVLRSDSIARLDLGLRETGYLPLASEAHAAAVFGDRVFLFGGPTVQILPFSRFNEPRSLPTPHPALPYTTHSADVADDGTLYLFDRAQRVVHRFSIPQWRYLPSVALPQEPLFAGVDRANSRVYVAYQNGRIGVIPHGAQTEQFLAFGPITASGLTAADEFVMTADDTGLWNTHRLYNLSGIQTDAKDGNLYSRVYAWNRQNRRAYFFRDYASPNDLVYETFSADGRIIESGDSPYHGEVTAQPPIRPSPTGALVYLGSGQAFDGITLTLMGSLPIQPVDATWLGNVLYTTDATATAGRTRVIRWNQNHTIAAAAHVAGNPVQAFAVGSQIITVANASGRTVIQRWPASLAGTNISVDVPYISPPAPLGQPVSFTLGVTNQGLEDAANVNVAVVLTAPVQQLTWLCDAGQGSIPCGSSTGLQLSLPLAVGETLRASAFGLMPNGGPSTIGFQASASGVAGDLDPTDNNATGQLGLLDTVFTHGFE